MRYIVVAHCLKNRIYFLCSNFSHLFFVSKYFVVFLCFGIKQENYIFLVLYFSHADLIKQKFMLLYWYDFISLILAITVKREPLIQCRVVKEGNLMSLILKKLTQTQSLDNYNCLSTSQTNPLESHFWILSWNWTSQATGKFFSSLCQNADC